MAEFMINMAAGLSYIGIIIRTLAIGRSFYINIRAVRKACCPLF